MANKTKVTSRNAFTVNLLALQSKKKLNEMTKRLSFGTTCRFLTYLLTLRPPTPHICGFLDYLSLSRFLATSCGVYHLKLNLLNPLKQN